MALRVFNKLLFRTFPIRSGKSCTNCVKQSCSRVPDTAQHANYVTVAKVHLNKNEIEVTFVKKNGERIKGKGKEGDSLLDVVVNNNLDFDGFGACEGTLTCSTCHVILKQADYDKLPEKPTEEEFDMLDLAYELSDTSRLGCQILLTKELNGLEVQLPATINDARAQ